MREKDKRNFRVVVLAGGDSAERQVSLASGASVAEALRKAGHQPLLVDPCKVDLDQVDWQSFDGCFLSLHGGAGEDGRIQRELSDRGVRFTGSNAGASRAAMSKSMAKDCFHRAGVPTPRSVIIPGSPGERFSPYQRVLKCQILPGQLPAAIDQLGYPLVIKPDAQGSSLGVGLVRGPGELAAMLADSSRFGWPILAEQYIAGREFTVTVLGRRALEPLEITGCGGIFDYDSKYSGNKADHHTPADLRPITLKNMQTVALRAAVALDTAGMVRVDLILDRDGQAWVLEVNTLPGMTPQSLAPQAVRRIGWEMSDLCDWMLREAVCQRTEDRC